MSDTTTKVVYKTKTSWVENLAFDNQIDQHTLELMEMAQLQKERVLALKKCC